MTGILEFPGIGTLHTLVPGLEFPVVDSRVLSDEPLNGEVSGKLTIDTAELDVFLSWPWRRANTPHHRGQAWPRAGWRRSDSLAPSSMTWRSRTWTSAARSTSAPSRDHHI